MTRILEGGSALALPAGTAVLDRKPCDGYTGRDHLTSSWDRSGFILQCNGMFVLQVNNHK